MSFSDNIRGEFSLGPVVMGIDEQVAYGLDLRFGLVFTGNRLNPFVDVAHSRGFIGDALPAHTALSMGLLFRQNKVLYCHVLRLGLTYMRLDRNFYGFTAQYPINF